jgi:uncharacterized protein with gpF-like domain
LASLNNLLYDIRRIAQHREVLTEKKIEAIYTALEKDLTAYIAEEYKNYADNEGRLFVSILAAKNRQAKFLQEIVKNVDSISPKLKKEFEKLIDDTYSKCYKGMAEAAKKADAVKLGKIAESLDVNSAVFIKSLDNNISKLVLPAVLEKHRNEIIYQIQQELNIGLINGDRYEQMARRISEKVGVGRSKANNIARTETHRNVEAGFMDSAQRIGESLNGSDLVYAATWRTMKDERVRPQRRYKTKKGWKTAKSRGSADHQSMEGITVKAGDLFKLSDGNKTKAPGQSGIAAQDCNCRCFLEYNLMTAEEFAEAAGKNIANVAKNRTSGIIKSERNVSNYLGKKIIDTDNKSVREWYIVNVSDIPNRIDKSKPLKEQARQAFGLRNKYKHEARAAMSDELTAKELEKKRPVPTFEELLNDKIKRKGLTEKEALKDILKTASKTNDDVNKKFGL